MWCLRFLKRQNLTMRTPTHISQPLKENAYQEIKSFFKNIIDMRKGLSIYDNIENIGNTDETPIWFEFYAKKAIAKIGEKHINIRTFGTEKIRITVLLTILGNGIKLPPLLVFKGKPNGNIIYNRLQKHPSVTKGTIIVKCQENSWVNQEIFLDYLTNIWLKPSIRKKTKNTLLIMDRAGSHFSDDISETFKIENCKYILIPAGMTRFLQPLDVCINKPFKDAFRKSYTDFEKKTV